MKKLINSVETVLSESLEGLAAAHSDILTLDPEHRFVRRRQLKAGKVALISGGGSGHEPLHGGLVGHGMLDAACPGQVFTSPTPDQMVAAVEAVAAGAGTVFVVKNYEGDVMNFDMAREMLGGNIETVLTDDDVAVENSLYTTGRRGVAGTLVVEKIAGAAAERGADLAAVASIGRKVNAATRSMGVALTSCTVPSAGKPTFAIADYRDGDGGRHPWRAGPPPRRAEAGRRYRRGNDHGDLQRSRGQGTRPGDRAGQRLRRDAADGALSDVWRRPPAARPARHQDCTVARRLLRHLARHGRVLDHRDAGR